MGTLILVPFLCVVTYVVWIVAPVLTDHFSVRGALHAALAKARLGANDDTIRIVFINEVRGIGSVESIDDQNKLVVEPGGMGFQAKDLKIDRNDDDDMVRLRISYERIVQLRPTPLLRVIPFNAVVEGKVEK